MVHTEIRSIVVRCPNWIGDAVMAIPVFSDLKQLFPNAHLLAVAPEHIGELLQGVHGIDDFLLFSKKKEQHPYARLTQELCEKKCDLGVLLTRSFSSAWMFWRAKIPLRLGFKDHFRSPLLNLKVSLPKEELHELLLFRYLLHPLGTVSSPPNLHLNVQEEELHAMKQRLADLGIRKQDQILLINPGAAYGSAKCWPKESFRFLAETISSYPHLSIIFIGDQSMEKPIQELITNLPEHVINLAGKTSIRELIALLSESSCLLTNDSGPMHIAAALKKPMLALFGSTNPKKTGPWNTGIVLYKKTDCSPCYKRVCPKDFRCMLTISPDEVFHHIKSLMNL